MGKIIAITNQKGGVGKTTTTVNLSAAIAAQGKYVLVIDIDPQGNATTGLGIEKSDIQECVYDILVNDVDPKDVIRETAFENLDIIPATINLSGAELELAHISGRERILKTALKNVKKKYDYIFLDCPPSLSLLTLNALTAAESIVVPIQAEYYALEGLTQLLNTVRLVQKHMNSKLGIEGILLTMTSNTNLSKEVETEVRALFDQKVFQTTISRGVRLSEAPSHGEPIMYYDAQSKGTQEYSELAREVIRNG
ncbi:MAG: ParA family protein [Culicoidibacterales bacterium]